MRVYAAVRWVLSTAITRITRSGSRLSGFASVVTRMSTRRRLDLRLPPELVERVDARAAELGQTRTKFVERALEAALGPQQGGKAREAEEPDVVKRGASASPRAHEPEHPEVGLPKIAKRKW
jgi:predicted transcriptional regulator